MFSDDYNLQRAQKLLKRTKSKKYADIVASIKEVKMTDDEKAERKAKRQAKKAESKAKKKGE